MLKKEKTPIMTSLLSNRLKKILQLALPMMTGMLSTNLIMLVDLAMVGLTGTVSLAAAGITGFVIYTASAAFYGLSSGIQSCTAHLVGQKKLSKTPFFAGLIINMSLSCLMITLLWLYSPQVVGLFSQDDAVIALGIPFLQWRLFGLFGLAVFSAFRGYWYAVNKPNTYLKILIVMQILNGLLNAVFMFGYFNIPAQGALGAAMASTLAIFLGIVMLVYQGTAKESLLSKKIFFLKRSDYSSIFSVSSPLMLQEFFFALSYTVFIAMIGTLGADALAIANVLITIILVIILPGKGLGSAAITLIGQALGAKEPKEARRWNFEISGLCVSIFAIFSLLTALFSESVLGIFLQDKSLIPLAKTLLYYNCASLWIEVIGIIMKDSLVGAQKSRLVMILSMFFQWGVLIPGIALICFKLKGNLMTVWLYDIAFQIFQSLVFVASWIVFSKKL